MSLQDRERPVTEAAARCFAILTAMQNTVLNIRREVRTRV